MMTYTNSPASGFCEFHVEALLCELGMLYSAKDELSLSTFLLNYG